MKNLNILFKACILFFLFGLLLSACGDSGASGSSHVQVLVSWTDESTDSTVPVTSLRMVKIATRATNSASPLTSTTVAVNGTLTSISDIKVWWNTEDNFATATQVGEKDSPDVGEAYTITLTGAGNASGFLYYTISIPGGQSGTYSMSVLTIAGADADLIPLPQSTNYRNIGGEGSGNVSNGSLKWIYETGGAVNSYSSPAIGDDGTIYFGSDDHYLYAINPNSTLKWRYETGDKITASPAIGSDGTIYVGSYDRQVYAINPDGTLKWVYPTSGPITNSPAIGNDGAIYIGGSDLDHTGTSFLHAINSNGKSKWYSMLCYSCPPDETVGKCCLPSPMNSSPTIGKDGTIYVGSSFSLYAIDSSIGKLKWSIPLAGTVNSSPTIGQDGAIYVGSDHSEIADGYLYSINPNGTLKWAVNTLGHVKSSPAIGIDGTIYVGSDKHDIYAINPNGTIKWVFPTRGEVRSSPAIGSNSIIYVGSNDGALYALNADDGALRWHFNTLIPIISSPSIVGPLEKESLGTIYAISSDGKLYAVRGDNGLINSPWPKSRHDLKNTGRK